MRADVLRHHLHPLVVEKCTKGLHPFQPFTTTSTGEILVAPFSDLEVVASLVREHRDELAGIILEPFQRIVPLPPAFLKACAGSPPSTISLLSSTRS
jgi:glutamate-1-semialdehyde aminotransferase